MLEQIHLEYGLLRSHGLEREAFGADNPELVLLLLLGHVRDKLAAEIAQRALAQTLLEPGLILADLALYRGAGGIDGCIHVVCELAGSVIHAVIVERDFNSASATLYAECDGRLAVVMEEPVKLSDFFFGVVSDLRVQAQLLFYEVEFHAVHSFCCNGSFANVIIQ